MNPIQSLALRIPQIRRMRDTRDALKAQNDLLAAETKRLKAENAALSTAAGQPSQQISPFLHYYATFDPLSVIHRHAVAGVEASPAHVTNFMGVKVPPKVFPSYLEERKGTVEAIPIPANWHADIAEWGACLRAVELARDTFTVVELGCGWGCWMNNTGVAARRLGLKVHLIGVEGDEGHIAFAQETFADNGFTPDQITLKRGIAATARGVALFPRRASDADWGSEPVFGATEAQQQQAIKAESHDLLPMVPLSDLLGAHQRIDLLHIDI